MTRSRRQVLVIDDDEPIRESLAEFLEDRGYEVVTAAGAAEALEICRRQPAPRLVLLDLRMPDMDGFEFVRLKAHDVALAPIPVCVMTASGPAVTVPAGAVAILRKPFHLEELASVVDRHCRG